MTVIIDTVLKMLNSKPNTSFSENTGKRCSSTQMLILFIFPGISWYFTFNAVVSIFAVDCIYINLPYMIISVL